MTRTIEWRPRALKDLDRLDREVNRRVRGAIERLAAGEGDVRHLAGIDPPLFRLRVGDWRVLFRYDGDTVIIVRVLLRDKAYR